MRARALRYHIALALLGLALAVRVLVPAGWMPAKGQGFAITICTGTGMETGWVDSDGTLHKKAAVQQGADPHCAFAGLGVAMLGGDVPVTVAPMRPALAPATVQALASIGQGLAAPPPPATGPPVTI